MLPLLVLKLSSKQEEDQLVAIFLNFTKMLSRRLMKPPISIPIFQLLEDQLLDIHSCYDSKCNTETETNSTLPLSHIIKFWTFILDSKGNMIIMHECYGPVLVRTFGVPPIHFPIYFLKYCYKF